MRRHVPLVALLLAAAEADIAKGDSTCAATAGEGTPSRASSLLQVAGHRDRSSDKRLVPDEAEDGPGHRVAADVGELKHSGHGRHADLVLLGSSAKLRVQGAVEAALVIILIVVAVTFCLLWHNNWSVQASVNQTVEVAGKAGSVAKKATHATAAKVEKMTRAKDQEQVSGGSSSSMRGPVGPVPQDHNAADTMTQPLSPQEPHRLSPKPADQGPVECC
mmetsp:Transcript_8154/g.25914  ORF Transcript_8154/g.25914 Transcript_8154/m.25914 type:complete len:219 (-) Transcript_8154:63-719(-)